MKYDPRNIPDGLDEAALLALAEATGTPGDLDALPPDLAALVAGMRADRAVVASLPEVSAPGDLVERAMARAQREALHNLRLVGERTEGLAVSTVIPRRPSFWTAPRRMAAAAAAVLLAAVGGVYVGVRALSGGSATRDPILAHNNDSTSRPEVGPIALNPEPLSNDPSDADTEPAAMPANPLILASEGASGARGTGGVVIPMLPSEARVSEYDRALALAREGRLVVRVVSRENGKISDRLAALAERREPSRVWTIAASAPPEFAAALTNPEPPPSRPEPRPAFAGEEWKIPMQGLDESAREMLRWRKPERLEQVSLASVAPSAEALRALEETLSDRLGEVEFAESDRPISASLSAPAARVLSPESLLWWTQPPAQWSAWIAVPVVIEQR